jgi:hypothetical protein
MMAAAISGRVKIESGLRTIHDIRATAQGMDCRCLNLIENIHFRLAVSSVFSIRHTLSLCIEERV